jgi:hypothetical protein
VRDRLRRISAVKLILGIAAVLCLALAGEASAAVVVVSANRLQPERVGIASHDTVHWENGTAVPQRIESFGQPSFDSFDLAASGAGERRFDRPGRYRYRVPGIGKEGVVVVAGAARGRLPGSREGSRRRSRSQGRGCNRRDVFLYDVSVKGKKTMQESWLPQFMLTGAFSIAYEYSALYRSVTVVVKRNCSTLLARASASQRGTARLQSYAWTDQVQHADPSGGTEQPCDFSAIVGGLGGRLRITDTAVSGGRARGWSLSVISRLSDDQRDALSSLLGARRDAVCDKGNLSNARIFDDLPGYTVPVPIFNDPYGVSGVKLYPPLIVLNGEFAGGGSGQPPRPLKALMRGRSFAVSSGARSYGGTSVQTQATATADVEVRFRRRDR